MDAFLVGIRSSAKLHGLCDNVELLLGAHPEAYSVLDLGASPLRSTYPLGDGVSCHLRSTTGALRHAVALARNLSASSDTVPWCPSSSPLQQSYRVSIIPIKESQSPVFESFH